MQQLHIIASENYKPAPDSYCYAYLHTHCRRNNWINKLCHKAQFQWKSMPQCSWFSYHSHTPSNSPLPILHYVCFL